MQRTTINSVCNIVWKSKQCVIRIYSRSNRIAFFRTCIRWREGIAYANTDGAWTHTLRMFVTNNDDSFRRSNCWLLPIDLCAACALRMNTIRRPEFLTWRSVYLLGVNSFTNNSFFFFCYFQRVRKVRPEPDGVAQGRRGAERARSGLRRVLHTSYYLWCENGHQFVCSFRRRRQLTADYNHLMAGT